MTDEKKAKYLRILIIVLIVILISFAIFWFIISRKKETILNIEAPEIMFVGESDYLKVVSNYSTNITTENGYITSNKSYYEEENPYILLNAIKSGQELITIKSNEKTKTAEVLVCDKLQLEKTDYEIQVNESENINLNIEGKCLAQYSIYINDQEIADYTDGVITGKKTGSTTLVISRANETIIYIVNVINKELLFDVTKTDFETGDKYSFSLINKREEHTCSTDGDLISVTKTDDGCTFEALKEGTAKIIANDGTRTAEATIQIKNSTVEVDSITMKSAVQLSVGNTYKLDAKIAPENATDKTITYTSNNTNIATVSNDTVKAIKLGTTTITAKTKNGKTATISIIVSGNKMVGSYESDTLKYWIDQRESTYAVTHIWVKDAYSQFKTAITSPKNANSLTPRIPQNAKTIITNAINSKNYQNKGLIAVNASAMVSSDFGKNAPSSWYGTSQIPLIINDGIVIRNSTSEEIKTDSTYVTYGLNRNGYLTYYKFNNGKTSEQKNQNKALVSTIINDGVLNTFGFKPVLLENGQVVSNSNDPNIRQGLCQVDKNNFIIITNTSSNRDIGFTFKKLAEEFKNLNCQTAFNLDGGRSTCIYYKYNNNTLKNVSTPYEGRLLSDMIYFVEK